MKHILALLIFSLALSGCISDSDDPQSPHDKYVDLLKEYTGGKVLEFYVEDTIQTSPDSIHVIHRLATVGSGTYDGVTAMGWWRISIDSEAVFLEKECGPEIGKRYAISQSGVKSIRSCTYDKPADFVSGSRMVKAP